MVIDPGDDMDVIAANPAKRILQVKQIVITHAHIDHVGGATKLRAVTGAPILLNQNDYALLKMLDMQASEDAARLPKIQASEVIPVDRAARRHAHPGKPLGPAVVLLVVRRPERHVVDAARPGTRGRKGLNRDMELRARPFPAIGRPGPLHSSCRSG